MQFPKFSDRQKKDLLRLGVQTVYLFGSRAHDKQGALSDYDYAVLVKNSGHAKGDDLYFKLYALFADISPRTLKNDVIDILFLTDAGLELRFHVIRYGKVLFDADTKARLDFETQTMLLYCDYRPVLDEFDRNILGSL